MAEFMPLMTLPEAGSPSSPTQHLQPAACGRREFQTKTVKKIIPNSSAPSWEWQ